MMEGVRAICESFNAATSFVQVTKLLEEERVTSCRQYDPQGIEPEGADEHRSSKVGRHIIDGF